MVSKQDGVSPRTASDIERKYNFGKSFAEVMGYASDAQKSAEKAQEAANRAIQALDGLDQDAIFNLLTNNGTSEGVFRYENGEIYINASYIKSGKFIADLIQSGKIKSNDGSMLFDLDGNLIQSVNEATDTELLISTGRFEVHDISNGGRYLRLGIGKFLNKATGKHYYKFVALNDLGTGVEIKAINNTVTIAAPNYDLPTEMLEKEVRWQNGGNGKFYLVGI